jgi:hypothetical protein
MCSVRFGHRPPGSVGRLVRRHGARQRHHLRYGFRRARRLAGLAGLVAQQTLDPALGKALLPPLHRRSADADTVRHLLRRMPIRRGKHDACSLHMLARPVAIGRDRRQLRALCTVENHTYRSSHGPHPQSQGPILHILTRYEAFE